MSTEERVELPPLPPELPKEISVRLARDVMVWGQLCYQAGVEAERERAAKVCEEEAREWAKASLPDHAAGAHNCVAAIRKG